MKVVRQKGSWMAAVVLLALPILLMGADPATKPAATASAHEQGMMHGDMQMPEEMQLRMKATMKAELTGEDPATLLALREELSLTDEQVQKLNAVVEQARSQAREILTADQQQTLKPLAQAPSTMKAMHEKMMEKMKAEGKMTYSCPMHPEVQQSEPGKCPKCNMALEMKGCPMCSMMGGMKDEKKAGGDAAGHVH